VAYRGGWWVDFQPPSWEKLVQTKKLFKIARIFEKYFPPLPPPKTSGYATEAAMKNLVWWKKLVYEQNIRTQKNRKWDNFFCIICKNKLNVDGMRHESNIKAANFFYWHSLLPHESILSSVTALKMLILIRSIKLALLNWFRKLFFG